jgi:signal transduction histidine kinase
LRARLHRLRTLWAQVLKGVRGLSEILISWMTVGNFEPSGSAATHPFVPALGFAASVLIALSFYSISAALIHFTYKRRNIHSSRPAPAFAALAFAVATSYLVSGWLSWPALYWMDAAVKGVTALISVAAAAFLWRAISKALESKPRSTQELHDVIRQLEHEINERRRAEQALHKSQELLHQLVAYQERVKEDERKRIAREIHDELGQNLMALRIDVSVLQARIAESTPALNERVRIALQHIDTSIKAVRIIINNLRPSVLDLGLHAAIEWQVNEFERRTGIACSLKMDEEQSGFNLDDNRATALFRILQESLTNVARHAQASQVEIDVGRQDDRFCMTISDNGVGLYPGCRRKPNSFGLLGIGERVSTLGGEFEVESDEGQGTVVRVTIPTDTPVATH